MYVYPSIGRKGKEKKKEKKKTKNLLQWKGIYIIRDVKKKKKECAYVSDVIDHDKRTSSFLEKKARQKREEATALLIAYREVIIFEPCT